MDEQHQDCLGMSVRVLGLAGTIHGLGTVWVNISWDDLHSLIGQKGLVLGHSVISKDKIGQRDLSGQS